MPTSAIWKTVSKYNLLNLYKSQLGSNKKAFPLTHFLAHFLESLVKQKSRVWWSVPSSSFLCWERVGLWGFWAHLAFKAESSRPGCEWMLLLNDMGQKPWVEDVLSSVILKPMFEQRKCCQNRAGSASVLAGSDWLDWQTSPWWGKRFALASQAALTSLPWVCGSLQQSAHCFCVDLPRCPGKPCSQTGKRMKKLVRKWKSEGYKQKQRDWKTGFERPFSWYSSILTMSDWLYTWFWGSGLCRCLLIEEICITLLSL